MPRPVLLVTGTSTGIGRATAIEAARAGWRVVATVRDVERAEGLLAAADAARVEFDLRELDVTDADSVAACLRGVEKELGGLDALVNNAGAGHLGTLELEDPEELRRVMEVTFFGTVAVTRAALPMLRSSRGRIVTVSSVGGAIGQPFNEDYCAAKFAVEGFFEALAPVAASVGVHVSLIEPGAVRSSFVENLGLDAGAMLAQAGPYAPAFSAYLDRVASSFSSTHAQDPSDVAAVIVKTLRDPEPPFRVQTSDWAEAFVGTKLSDRDGSRVQSAMRGWIGIH
ncbi:SDR family NAD(P)-dependent oxidoreductase [Rathayibacter tritici]|uniref:Short-chain dehydrogenase n=1 Tax=Rathayibacter tritici TaxID=33888 RepID=A0A169BUB0_9MICO|nr:SDR family oxidoreductase [Rathayibacter tritici]AND15705.1 short-chain dehydrogenase [Rathayibacter tritici]PPF30496.1 SDR family NAD(P)-dependent oxidoreductase [Rathayibacter tritici]PPF66971.1 SDR family NAD(P)-dependent oxidoreductase [Rathayibacter tritici]PPG06426.1 SDR family NAD(P)-dependent oxidoreductase [Rathayibacter tritici]PPI16619.1 SDR family NAD(P)-dependent oxidoreductase [Rathayibacter tritici]